MNVQNVLASFSQNQNAQGKGSNLQSSNTPESIGDITPGGVAGGAVAGGIMALILGNKSTRKMANTVLKFGGTAVIGGLAYKAYDNWQTNKALGQTQPITDQDIDLASETAVQSSLKDQKISDKSVLNRVLINAMIAASKADGRIDTQEHQRLLEAIERLNFNNDDKAAVIDAMSREISVQELASAVSLDEHKAEVYLAAYLAIEVDDQQERTFLNNLAFALQLPKGFPAYLEQQADQGVTV